MRDKEAVMEETTGVSGLVGSLPGVTQYSFTLEDIDGEGSTRTEDGYMHREVIRQNVVHASVTHRVDTEGLGTIISEIKQGETVETELYTPGYEPSGTYYCSKLTASMVAKTQEKEIWDVSYELVEV